MATLTERLNVKRNDANELCMYICACKGEPLCTQSYIPRCQLCVSFLRSAATKTHHFCQEISQPVTVERWCCWPTACIKCIVVRSCLTSKSVSVQQLMVSFNFPPKKGKEQISYEVPHSADINSCHAIVFLVCTFRSPSETQKRTSVLGAALRPAGDPLVL